MLFKADPAKVSPELCKLYAEAVDDFAERNGKGRAWSTSEQIAAALILGKPDLLPPGYADPIDAIERLNSGGESSWHTVLHLREVGLDKYLSAGS